MLGNPNVAVDVVLRGEREGGDGLDNKKRERKNSDNTASVGGFERQLRNDLQVVPTYPTPSVMIVDFESFVLDDNNYIKELAFYDPFQMGHWVTTFDSPFELSSLKRSCVRKIEQQTFLSHGLEWESGISSYTSQFQILQSYASTYTLYAQNKEKCEVLEKLANCTIWDLTSMNVPSVYSLPFGSYCYFHDSMKFSCALDKATRLGRYYLDIFSKQ